MLLLGRVSLHLGLHWRLIAALSVSLVVLRHLKTQLRLPGCDVRARTHTLFRPNNSNRYCRMANKIIIIRIGTGKS